MNAGEKSWGWFCGKDKYFSSGRGAFSFCAPIIRLRLLSCVPEAKQTHIIIDHKICRPFLNRGNHLIEGARQG